MREQELEQNKGREQLPDGEYGSNEQYISVRELGVFIQAAIANSFPKGERRVIVPDAEIQFHIYIENGAIDPRHTYARVMQGGPEGFNRNIIPSNELCRLLIEYEISHKGKETS